jgi:hypothetical protein
VIIVFAVIQNCTLHTTGKIKANFTSVMYREVANCNLHSISSIGGGVGVGDAWWRPRVTAKR